MEMLCTMFIGGVLLSIGWRVGGLIYEWIYEFIMDAPDGIRKIRRYQNRKKHRGTSYVYYPHGNRRRS